jgi:hypothetical protein
MIIIGGGGEHLYATSKPRILNMANAEYFPINVWAYFQPETPIERPVENFLPVPGFLDPGTGRAQGYSGGRRNIRVQNMRPPTGLIYCYSDCNFWLM